MSQKCTLRVHLLRAAALSLWVPMLALAQAPAPTSPPVAQGVTITECTVYTLDKSKSFDCLAKARAACAEPVPRCELPIGYALTDGRDLDGNRRTWEKVRVRIKCGAKDVTRGPHFQNDHASMVLTCVRAA